MIIVSVVRNFSMYNQLVKDNPFNRNAKFVTIDNTKDNRSISSRYNQFLNEYDYAKNDWFVFCHEDWEIKEDWEHYFADLDKNSIYGPIGISGTCLLGKRPYTVLCGQITNSNKDCSKVVKFGLKTNTGTKVQTFDCQCLIVHSSLVKRYDLRFDEQLSFDLYVEDFCANAKENHGIISRIIFLDCQHYSFGKIKPIFIQQLEYLKTKYHLAKNGYCSTADKGYFGNFTTFDNKIFMESVKQRISRFLLQKSIKNNKMKVKICKISLPGFLANKFTL